MALHFAADTWGHCCSVLMPQQSYKQEVGGGQIRSSQSPRENSDWGHPAFSRGLASHTLAPVSL